MEEHLVDIQTVSKTCAAIREQAERAIIGKGEVLSKALMAILANGHILIEDVPGLAKTLLARSIAMILNMSFSRIQFTPDLVPADITGANIFDQQNARFTFSPGPLFANLVLADEINRASPKTQSAMLEAMQERQITIDGKAHILDSPFLVCATQNPIELEGTYPLPEAQLDRFLVRIQIGYPSENDEFEILARRQQRKHDEVELKPLIDREDLLQMQAAVEEVHVSEEVGRYIVRIVRETRNGQQVQIGSSPRGTLALFKLSRSSAALEGRDFVTPEDVKRVSPMALAHRIILKPEAWVRKIREETFRSGRISSINARTAFRPIRCCNSAYVSTRT